MGSCATPEEHAAAAELQSDKWTTILDKTKLMPGYPETRHHLLDAASSQQRWTHLRCAIRKLMFRINMFPDGGIARLRVYGIVRRDWTNVSSSEILDLASLANGYASLSNLIRSGKALSYTNAHYGHPMILLAPGDSKGMFDGWETARNPNRPHVYEYGPDGHLIIPGSESTIIELGHAGKVVKVQVDTHHYKGNFPESCQVEGLVKDTLDQWVPLVARVKLGPNASRSFEVNSTGTISQVKLTMFPDGGVSRLRIYGHIG